MGCFLCVSKYTDHIKSSSIPSNTPYREGAIIVADEKNKTYKT